MCQNGDSHGNWERGGLRIGVRGRKRVGICQSHSQPSTCHKTVSTQFKCVFLVIKTYPSLWTKLVSFFLAGLWGRRLWRRRWRDVAKFLVLLWRWRECFQPMQQPPVDSANADSGGWSFPQSRIIKRGVRGVQSQPAKRTNNHFFRWFRWPSGE